MVLKTMSSNEAKQKWGEVIRIAESPQGAVIVESHGKPKVAVISIERFDALVRAEAASKREADLEWLRKFEQTHRDPGSEFSDEEVEELSVRLGREVNRAAALSWKLDGQREHQ
jgi:prevent-host-death family protein